MSNFKPNPNAALRPKLSRRLRDHIDSQLGKPTRSAPRAPAEKWTFYCTISRPMYDLIHSYAEQQDISVNELFRTALKTFLNNPVVRSSGQTPYSRFAKRSTALNFVVSANKNPGLYDQLEQHMSEHHLHKASVVRRAIYEYIRDKNEPEDPVLRLDAWGDAPRRLCPAQD